MIQLKISGRAGNQFFQYAMVKSYMDENNIKEELQISFEHLEKHKTDNNSFVNILKDFNVQDFEVINKINMTLKQKILDIIYKIFCKIIIFNAKAQKRSLKKQDYEFVKKHLQKILNKNGLYYYIPGMKEFYESNNKNIIFYGSFEDNSFYIKNREKILQMYTPKSDILDKNKELYENIERSESVCVTIRRGDFLNSEFKKNFYICTPQYFEDAIQQMDKIVKNPQYIVFSDDVEWCKNNMKFPEGTLFETENNPIWEKIRLMYSCKHFIISNSTFSWWAQYLSRNENKKVIAPKRWNNFEYMDLIYNKSWILL